MRELTVCNLGGGVQSSAMLHMLANGTLDGPVPDCAIFADTGWEPDHVYQTVHMLSEMVSVPVLVVSGGDIRDDCMRRRNASGQEYHSMPLRVRFPDGRKSIRPRQCTANYKIRPIHRKIRELLGLRSRQHVPRGTVVRHLMGISLDEIQRMRTAERHWEVYEYPLVEARLTRADCMAYVEQHLPDVPVGKSACLGCPYHSKAAWVAMAPQYRNDVIAVDEQIRDSVPGRELYLHGSLRPLREVFAQSDLQPSLFGDDDDGSSLCDSGHCFL